MTKSMMSLLPGRKGLMAGTIAGVLLAGTAMVAADKKGDPEKGKEVFEQCSVCHNVETDEKKTGPSLKGLFKKDKMKNGKKPSDASVTAVVNAGGNGMPAYADMLTDEERNNLLAYLKVI